MTAEASASLARRVSSGPPLHPSEGESGPRPRSSLPCFGRGPELLRVLGSLDAAERSHGGLWVVTGTAGIGKSRFIVEAETLARRRGFLIRKGYAVPGTTIPQFPLLQAFDLAPAAARSRRKAKTPSGGPSRTGRSGRPRQIDSVDRSTLEMMQRLRAEAAEAPVLLVVDDLQQADPETLRSLYLLARAATGLRALIIVGLRDDPAESPNPLERILEQFSALQRSGGLDIVRLEPLPHAQRLELVAAYLAREPRARADRPTLERLAERSGGNPYYLLESVDALLRPSDATKRRRQNATSSGPRPLDLEDEGPVPDTVRRLLLDRLSAMPARDRELMALAARLGTEFDVEPLDAALGGTGGSVRSRLDRWARVSWPIRFGEKGPGTYGFDHGLLRDTLRDPGGFPTATESLRRMATWWHAHRPHGLMTGARLWAELGDTEELVATVRRMIDQSLDRRAYRQVPGLLRWLVAQLPRDVAGGAVARSVAVEVVERLRRDFESEGLLAVLDLIDTLQQPPELEVRTKLHRIETISTADPRRAANLLEEIERQLERAPALADAEVVCKVEYLRGLLAVWNLPPREGSRIIFRSLRLLRRRPGVAFETLRLLGAAIGSLQHQGRMREARTRLREARRLARVSDIPKQTSALILEQAEINIALSGIDWPLARRLTLRQIERNRALGYLDRVAMNYLRLGAVEMSTRELPRAREHIRMGLELMVQLDLESLRWAADTLDGWTRILLRDWEGAERALGEAAKPVGGVTDSANQTFARIGLELVRAERGDPRAAIDNLLDIARGAGAERLGFASEYFRSEARIRELMGDAAGSRRALRRAWSIAGRLGSRLDRVGAAAELLEWHRLHAKPRDVRRWQGHYRRACGLAGVSPRRDWKGIAFPLSATTPLLPTTRTATDRVVSSPRGPMRELILDYLHRPTERDFAAGPLYSERELAEQLGVPRDRFARTLRRLLEAGLVERAPLRSPDGSRAVYGYRSSPPSS